VDLVFKKYFLLGTTLPGNNSQLVSHPLKRFKFIWNWIYWL